MYISDRKEQRKMKKKIPLTWYQTKYKLDECYVKFRLNNKIKFESFIYMEKFV